MFKKIVAKCDKQKTIYKTDPMKTPQRSSIKINKERGRASHKLKLKLNQITEKQL